MSLLQSATYIRERYQIPLTVKEIMDGINHTVEDFYFHTVQPKECVVAFLEQMKMRGVKMCIATATDRYQVEAALKRCGIESFFSEIFTCTDVGHGKDEPIIFQKAMEYLGKTKADKVVFEDAYHAAKTAKADGFITVAVYDSYETKQAELHSVSDCFLESFTHTEHFWKFANGL
jgi:HAD superfamily hydrolase (TIGR01509 family)